MVVASHSMVSIYSYACKYQLIYLLTQCHLFIAEEKKRLNSFRRECLSKAIQWNHVDLVNASPEKQIILPKWLSKDEAILILEGRDMKIHLRRFLCVLRKKEFGTMQEWLNNSGFDDSVVKTIWDTFVDFSDIQRNKSIMKCFRCRLIENISALDVADYLYSADIISSEQLYLKICNSKLPVGSQEGLWKLIIEECNGYLCTSAVNIALKVALIDKCISVTETERIEYESLLSDLDHIGEDPQDLLVCHCNERCSRSFHPVSCLKSMSLAGVYFSPPTQRRKEKSSTSSSNDPESSLSSNSSIDSICSPNGETGVKVPIDSQDTITGHTDIAGSKRDREKFQSCDRSNTLRRKKTHIKEERLCSESSLESVDCEDRTLGQVRNNYKSMTNTVSRRLENKPNIINAQTVYLDTGNKYIHVAKARSCTQSSETEDGH